VECLPTEPAKTVGDDADQEQAKSTPIATKPTLLDLGTYPSIHIPLPHVIPCSHKVGIWMGALGLPMGGCAKGNTTANSTAGRPTRRETYYHRQWTYSSA
jgi:hypothetical protein